MTGNQCYSTLRRYDDLVKEMPGRLFVLSAPLELG